MWQLWFRVLAMWNECRGMVMPCTVAAVIVTGSILEGLLFAVHRAIAVLMDFSWVVLSVGGLMRKWREAAETVAAEA